ncbi:MAG: MarR family transcriptional regulator [Oscillochloridaceae bacterium umkhey_bin13]
MHDLTVKAQRLLELLGLLRPQLFGPAMQRLSALDLSPSHIRVLHLLAQDSPVPMKQIADQLCVKPPSVTALTRHLTATGLVERLAHPEDSRMVLLGLTEAGHALHQQVHAEQLERMASLLARLDPAEQAQLLDLLARALAVPPPTPE